MSENEKQFWNAQKGRQMAYEVRRTRTQIVMERCTVDGAGSGSEFRITGRTGLEIGHGPQWHQVPFEQMVAEHRAYQDEMAARHDAQLAKAADDARKLAAALIEMAPVVAGGLIVLDPAVQLYGLSYESPDKGHIYLLIKQDEEATNWRTEETEFRWRITLWECERYTSRPDTYREHSYSSVQAKTLLEAVGYMRAHGYLGRVD